MTSTGYEPTYTWSEVQKQIETAVKHDRKQRTWVGLTDEEISDMFCVTGTADADINLIKLLTDARRIEAKLKEKNT